MNIETLIMALLFGFGLFLPWTSAAWLRWRARGEAGLARPVGWRAFVHSMLAYILAFNITFFIQELFLVLPKAFVPGLEPTLFHNNHDWAGDAHIAELFQGTGALAILISGLLFSWIASRQARPSFIILWMAFNGLFQSLPQFVVGAFEAGNDMGRSYDYLLIGTVGETVLALLALAAMPWAGRLLAHQFLRAAWSDGQLSTSCQRAAFSWWMVGLPALAAIPLVILYRVPREPLEVLSAPILIPLFGYGWMLLAAFRAACVTAAGKQPHKLLPLLVAAAALLAFFQIILRPGISF